MRLTFEDTHGETVSTEDTLNHMYPDSQQRVSQGKQQTLVSGTGEWNEIQCPVCSLAKLMHITPAWLVIQEHGQQPCSLEMLLELRGCNWSCPAFTGSEMSREGVATESPKQTHIKLFQ